MKYIDAEKLKAKIERLKSTLADPLCSQGNILGLDWVAGGNKMLNKISSVIDSLQQEQSKFNIGDLVVSKKNPHLTYRILATNIPNELGKTDYKVEIFTDGKPGLLDKPHNIHLISSDKIENWGELVQ